MPFFIAPVVGHLAALFVHLYRRKALEYLVPAVQDRMNIIQRKKTDPTISYEPPLDILQWCIMACTDETATEVANAILLLLSSFHPSIAHFLKSTNSDRVCPSDR